MVCAPALLRTASIVVPLACVSAPLARAADRSPMECARAAERAQTLRDAAKLVEARAELLVCARDDCPRAVSKDCLGWIREVEQSLPTIVLGARDENGADLVDVRVSVDGVATVERLDGSAVPIDPGEHVLRFERAGAQPTTLRLVVHEGEKNRLVSVQWGAAANAAGDVPAGGDHRAAPGVRHTAWPWVLGGLGAVATGLAAWGIASGLSDKSTLQSGCGSTPLGCTSDQIDSARTKVWIGDIAAGVAVVSFAAAAWLFLSERTTASVAWRSGGPSIMLSHVF